MGSQNEMTPNSLNGNLAVAGNPIKDVDVVLKKVPGGEIAGSTKTAEDGSFTLDGIETGNYKLGFAHVNVSHEIRGKIILNGQNSGYYETALINSDGTAVADGQTQENGNFLFENVAQGVYNLMINVKF